MRPNLNRILALAFIVVAFLAGFAFGGPPQRPGPLQRPPLREVVGESTSSFQWVVTHSTPPAVEIVKKVTKVSCCSDACTCGCVEGGECKCAAASSVLLPPAPSPQPVPIPYYGAPVYSPTYSSPGMPPVFSSGVMRQATSFGNGFRSFGGSNCANGSCR